MGLPEVPNSAQDSPRPLIPSWLASITSSKVSGQQGFSGFKTAALVTACFLTSWFLNLVCLWILLSF